MARKARAPEQISAMVGTEHNLELLRIADQYDMSFSAALREALDVALPTLAERYPPLLSEEELAAAELARAARRG